MEYVEPDSCYHCIAWWRWRITLYNAAGVPSWFNKLKFVYYWQRVLGERP